MQPRKHSGRGFWRVVSIEGGKKMTGPTSTRGTATRTMRHLLEAGTPAWLEYVPYFEDDDVPF